MSDEAFARAFERGEIASSDFRHGSHLRLALTYVEACGSPDEAGERMAAVLRRFAALAGHPKKYHYALTLFWMRIVAPLLDKDLPLAYYSRERLFGVTRRAPRGSIPTCET